MKDRKFVKTYYFLDENDYKDIKKQMVDLNLNGSRLAKKLYISDAYLSAILHGKRRVTPEMLEALKNEGIIINEGE